MKHTFQKTLIATAVLALGATSAFAQFGPFPGAKSGEAKSATPAVPKDDLEFMQHAAAGGLLEVELGKIAQSRATNAQVKQFAARIVQDHTKGNEELKKVAAAKGVTLPATVERKQRKAIDELKAMPAPRFDHEYMEYMVKDHREDIKAFDKEAKSGKDADVKAFAAKTLPTLHEHLQLAEGAQGAVRTTAK
jgi:putative membrane protein